MPVSRVIELRACGPEDPEAARTSRVVDAYLAAARARAVRRLVWRQIAVIGMLGWLIEATTPLISAPGLARGLGTLGVIVVGVTVAEWLAGRRVTSLLARPS